MWRELVLEPVPWAQVRHTTRKPRRGPTMAAAFHPRRGMSCSRHARCRTLGAGRAARPLGPSTAALHALHARSMSTPRERVGQETQAGRSLARDSGLQGVGFEWKQEPQALCGDAREIGATWNLHRTCEPRRLGD